MLIRSHHSLRQAELGILRSWAAKLDAAVNKRDLSTGETGELAPENVGIGLNPGVEGAPPRSPVSNWRIAGLQVPAKCLGYGVRQEGVLSTRTR
jgi:hypothetical protein